MQQEHLDALATALAEMRASAEIEAWEEPHRRFHHMLVVHTGPQICATIESYSDQSRRYHHLLGQVDIHAGSVSMVEHGMILQACLEHNREEAAQILARHLARTALIVLAHLAPTYEPLAVRAALALAQVGIPLTEETSRIRKHVGSERSSEAIMHVE